jgi:hypothetical protein
MTEYILAPWLGMSGEAMVAGYARSGGRSELTAAGACCGFSCAWIVFTTHSTEQSSSTSQPICFMVRYHRTTAAVLAAWFLVVGSTGLLTRAVCHEAEIAYLSVCLAKKDRSIQAGPK